ncbi:hypothetical protein [Cyanobacterium sp. HL-69]
MDLSLVNSYCAIAFSDLTIINAATRATKNDVNLSRLVLCSSWKFSEHIK